MALFVSGLRLSADCLPTLHSFEYPEASFSSTSYSTLLALSVVSNPLVLVSGSHTLHSRQAYRKTPL